MYLYISYIDTFLTIVKYMYIMIFMNIDSVQLYFILCIDMLCVYYIYILSMLGIIGN